MSISRTCWVFMLTTMSVLPMAGVDIVAVLAQEAAFQQTVVRKQAGGYAATVTAADPIFAIPAGATLTVVVVPLQDGSLGWVGVGIGDEKITCKIDTAEGGRIGFSDATRAGYLSGTIRIDDTGAPIQVVLTRGTLDGLSTLYATLVRLPDLP